jgi:hypothetical protein
MRKHIFKTSNIFFKKEHSKHVRILAVCNTQKTFFYIFFIENTSNAIKHKRKIAIKAKSRHIYSKIYNKLKAIIKNQIQLIPRRQQKQK